MPRHLAIGANIIKGKATLENTKSIFVPFIDKETGQQYFTKQPNVSLTVNSETTAPPANLGFKKTGVFYSGFTIKFPSNVSLTVDWFVTE